MNEKKRILSFLLCSIIFLSGFICGYAIGNRIGIERSYRDIKEEQKKMQIDIDLMKAAIPDTKEDCARLMGIFKDMERNIKLQINWNKQTTGPTIRKTKPDQGAK